jgi:hypothetical protein
MRPLATCSSACRSMRSLGTTATRQRVMDKCGLRFQGELHLPQTVVAWYAIDQVHWQANQAAAAGWSYWTR